MTLPNQLHGKPNITGSWVNQLRNSIPIILDMDSRPVGVGMYLEANCIATCTFVITASMHIGTDQTPKLEGNVLVPVKFSELDNPIMAVIEGWYQQENLAVLRFDGQVLKKAKPLALARGEGSEGKQFRTLGLEEKLDSLVWASGKIMGKVDFEKYPFQFLQLKSTEITRGFGGAPVFEEETRMVVGMVHSFFAEGANSPRGIAFAIPTEEFSKYIPSVRFEHTPWESEVIEQRNEELVSAMEELISSLSLTVGNGFIGPVINLISDNTGYSKTTINNWRQGTATPNRQTAERLTSLGLTRGSLNQDWAIKFLRSINHPDPNGFSDSVKDGIAQLKAEDLEVEPVHLETADLESPSPRSKIDAFIDDLSVGISTHALSYSGKFYDGQRYFREIFAGAIFWTSSGDKHTITALVIDRETQKPVLLLPTNGISNNEEIVQSARYSSNKEDAVALVYKTTLQPTCVAGIAQILGDRPFLSILPNESPLKGVDTPGTNSEIGKFGAETGYTTGHISKVNQQILITIGSKEIELSGAFLVNDAQFAQPGDEGAMVFCLDANNAIGMIVGFDNGGAVCLPIQPILDRLNVELINTAARYRITTPLKEDLEVQTDQIFGKDRLGFQSYVDAFVRLINDTQPPLTIGIYGAWGTGKSFLMNKIAEHLKSPEAETNKKTLPHIYRIFSWLAKGIGNIFSLLSRFVSFINHLPGLVGDVLLGKYPEPKEAKNLVVWFDAWDFNTSDKLWAGLVERIFCILEDELKWYQTLPFNLKRNFHRQWKHIRPRILPYSLLVLVALVSTLVLWINDQQDWASVIGLPTLLVLIGGFVRAAIDLLQTSESQRVFEFFTRRDYTVDMGFMGRIKDDLETFSSFLPIEDKVIIFIDDLDRCDPKKSVEVLEAIKLLLELDRFIVFLALDARIITQAIEEHYGDVLKDAEVTGYEYLDKIVQIPFSIPEPKPEDLANYLGSLVRIPEDKIANLLTEPERIDTPQSTVITEEPIVDQSPPDQSVVDQTTDDSEDQSDISDEEKEKPDDKEKQKPPPEISNVTIASPSVDFSEEEQKAFLNFHSYISPNPRRIKRLANIYRLVRSLILSQGGEPIIDIHNHPETVMGWLILCEQWPYAAHLMMDIFDQNLRRVQSNQTLQNQLLGTSVFDYFAVVKSYINSADDQGLKKLDMKHSLLERFLQTFFHEMTLAEVQKLRVYTVNFNPALSAEVRMALAKSE